MTRTHTFASYVRYGEPGIFALVMATGIVALALDEEGYVRLGLVLYYLNLLAYAAFILLGLARACFYFEDVVHNFNQAGRAAPFLTLIAGTFVLANQSMWQVGWHNLAQGLVWWGCLCWLVLVYGFFLHVISTRHKTPFDTTIHGSWLLVVVATQAMVISLVLLTHNEPRSLLVFVATGLFLVGGAWYFILITLIVYRMVFRPFSGIQFTPPYWINMGALAITTLAGSVLLTYMPKTAEVYDLVSFIKGVTLLSWSLASWWIPLLIGLQIWRHARAGVALVYSVGYWSMVFPLGMYVVATNGVATTFDMPQLHLIGHLGVYVSTFVWVLVALGFMRHLLLGRSKNTVSR